MSDNRITKACEDLLKELFGEDILKDPNFRDTPKRMSNMYRDMFTSCNIIDEIAKALMDKSFPSSYTGMILLPNISTVSFCPHHMLPVEYKIIIGYIPNCDIRFPDCALPGYSKALLVGASKPERLACVLAKHPILQETYTQLIAEYIQNSINPLGVAVIVKGFHSCMRIRGIKNSCANMITSEMLGAFQENHRTQAELFSLINLKM